MKKGREAVNRKTKNRENCTNAGGNYYGRFEIITWRQVHRRNDD